MGWLDLEVTVNDGGLLAKMEAFRDAFRDLTPLWPLILSEFLAIEGETFDSEGGIGASGSWAPLSPTYAEWKRRNYGELPILHLTGALRESLTSEAAAEVSITAQQMVIGTPIPYAVFHQEGSPRRPVIDLSPASEQRLLAVALEWTSRLVEEIFDK